MFEFEIDGRSGLARAGRFKTPHGEVMTPMFMPCGTKGAVKSLHPTELRDIGTQFLLGNTYHLYLRPGSELIAQMGGLHKWMKWEGPILTDSGGFQVFSLKDRMKIKEDGVEFRSHLDGSKHFFSPKKVIDIQMDLGSDVMMVLDECAPGDSDKAYAKVAMERTHRWAVEAMDYFSKVGDRDRQTVFPIIQGVVYDDLRVESTKFISSLGSAGVAIGGLSVGESKEDMYRTLDVINPHLPEAKPRYLMGVGTPEDLIEGVYRGVDMFDCVLATRLARHATFWDETGRHNLLNAKYKMDTSEIGGFTKSYLHHLFRENEILAHRILSIHNLSFLFDLMSRARDAILEDRFGEFRNEFYSRYTV